MFPLDDLDDDQGRLDSLKNFVSMGNDSLSQGGWTPLMMIKMI